MNTNTTATIGFDPIKYKQTTREQWDGAARAWNDWGPLLSRWLGPATETMLDMAAVRSGGRVLDVAAGAGEQSLAAARRVGSQGRVLATDLSPTILDYAQHNAKLAGFDNIDTAVIDGEDIAALDANGFDAVISRVGLIYFPNQRKALAGMRSKLGEQGRIGVMVYSTAEHNAFFSLPVSIIRRRAKLPPPQPGQPGPFCLGDAQTLADRLTDAGYRHVDIETIDAPVRLDSAGECLRFEQESFGALHQMLSGLPATEQDEAWDEIEEALGQFESDGQFRGPCEMLVAAASR